MHSSVNIQRFPGDAPLCSCHLPALFFLGAGRLRDSINICWPLVLTMWTSLQICWKVIWKNKRSHVVFFHGVPRQVVPPGLTGLCKAATAAASSMAGPLLSLDEAALRCC